VPGPVLEFLGPARLGDPVATDLVDVPLTTPAATRATPAAWASATTSNTRASSGVGGATDAEGAGHVRAVAVESGAEVDHDRVAGGDGAVARSGVGLAAFGPEATMVRRRGPANRGRRMAVSRARGHLLFGASLPEHLEHLAQAASAMEAAMAIRATSPGVFHQPQPSTTTRRWPPARPNATRPRPGCRPNAVARPSGCSRPRGRPFPRCSWPGPRWPGAGDGPADHQCDRTVQAGPLQLLGRLGAVAAVVTSRASSPVTAAAPPNR